MEKLSPKGKKWLLAGTVVAGLLLFAIVAYLMLHTLAPAVVPTLMVVPPKSTAVVVPPEKMAVIVPAVDVKPNVPEVIFIGVTTVSPQKYQAIYKDIIVTFSEAMNPATVNSNTFMVKGPNNTNIKGLITSDVTKKIWTFNPTDNLVSSSVYEIMVTTGAKGVSGNSLAQNFVWSFTTNQIMSGGGGGGSGASPPAPHVLKTITISLTSTNLSIGSTQQLTVTSLDQFGSPIAATISYATSNSSVATVNNSGAVTAVAAGNATITAKSGSIKGTISIYVVAAQPTGPAAVNLGTAGDFVILSKSGISTTGATLITGDIGVSPIDHTAITGFSETIDSTNQFSTSAYVIGKLYAADYATPTPTKLTTAISDMEIAYTDAAGRTNPAATELGAGNIDGMTLAPGLYKWGTGVTIPIGVTLSGGANDVWIFQIAQDLTVGNGAIVTLSGGAQAKNIFWQVGGQATLGTTSDFKGNILSQTLIEMQTGAKLNGRALAQTAVTLDANPVTTPN